MTSTVENDAVSVPIDIDHGRVPYRGGGVIAETSLSRQRDQETRQCQRDLSHAHADLNRNYEEESQDEEQEWDPSTVEFMERRLRIIQTEAGNATVGSGEQHCDGPTMTRGLRCLSCR